MKTFKQFIAEELRQITGQQGSNPGGVYKDSEDDSEHYIKHPKNSDQAKTEVLSAKIHKLLGVNTLNPKIVHINPKTTSVSTKYNPNLEPIKSSHIPTLTSDHHKQLGKIYAAGVLTKNWDAMGTGIEYGQGNVALDKKRKHLVSMDQGGSFNFRAQGGHKPYGSDIEEKDSLLDPSVSEGSHYFHKALNHPGVKEHVTDALRNLDLDRVHRAFKTSGLHNWKELHANFIDRHAKLLNHFENN